MKIFCPLIPHRQRAFYVRQKKLFFRWENGLQEYPFGRMFEQAWYSRSGGNYRVDLRKDYVDGRVREDQWTGPTQPYDLVSIMLHARSLDLDALTVGQRLTFPVVDSKKVLSQTLVYLGRQQMKAEGGGLVECHAFSLKGSGDDAKEVLRFYLSTAPQHVPVQIDINFRFGSAKAKLR